MGRISYVDLALEVLKDNPGSTAEYLLEEMEGLPLYRGKKPRRVLRPQELAQRLIRSGHAISKPDPIHPTKCPRIYFYKE